MNVGVMLKAVIASNTEHPLLSLCGTMPATLTNASLGRCCIGSLLEGGVGRRKFLSSSLHRWLAKRMSKERCCVAGDMALLAPGCSALETILERSCCNLFVASMTFVDSSWMHSGNGLDSSWMHSGSSVLQPEI